MSNFFFLAFILLTAIILIVWLTAKAKVHPFFALVLAALYVGVGAGIPIGELLVVLQDGFGKLLRSLGFLIILGTTLGILLEVSGSTKAMALAILKLVGERNTAFAMTVTGLVVGLPIFCDSGFIVLSGLILPLAIRSGLKVASLAVCLATGLYSVHCLIPPHPGASAATSVINADFGAVVLYGIVVAIPCMLVGYFWANYQGAKVADDSIAAEPDQTDFTTQPGTVMAFLPVIIPIILIAAKSFLAGGESASIIAKVLSFCGEPVVALAMGILIALFNRSLWISNRMATVLADSVQKAAGILVIIGAGGAFGAVLAATRIGDHFVAVLPLSSLGILFPFLLTFLLKTAQGSSTVAIITAASIIQPLLKDLALDTESGRVLCVLAMGAGSMMISHANDAYFWVISNFENISLQTMLKVYSLSTILMGLVAFAMVYVLSLFI